MKHIYLAGPVSGRPKEESAAHFAAAEQEIRRKAETSGIAIHTENPTRFCPAALGGETAWHLCMRLCVGELARSAGIALLQGWEHSRGARLELQLAQELRIPVVYIEPPIGFLNISDIFTAAPEVLRYYNARLAQFQREGVEESLAEDRATVEMANRFLDPYGFEYTERGD